MSAAGVWACVGLGVLLGAALPYWPYDRACGSWLLLYMVAVGIVFVAGIWGARVSWKSRFGLIEFAPQYRPSPLAVPWVEDAALRRHGERVSDETHASTTARPKARERGGQKAR